MNKPLVIVTHPLPQAWMEDDQTEFQFVFRPEYIPGVTELLSPYINAAEGLISLVCDPI